MAEPTQFSRREFIKGVGALGAASLTLWAGGCESCIQQINQEIQHRPTRKNIQKLWDANPSDPVIATYKKAVTMMKALPSSDMRSWQNQANIHFNACLHRNWLWLPWHRAYLLYFERICRKLTKDDSFALPYWNWNTHPAVPDPFWESGSSLLDSTRAITQSDKADPSFIGDTVLNNILNEPSFELFASSKPMAGQNLHFPANGETATEGMLEATPHDNIHVFVGGDMLQFHSPLDPVFWTHHCMLDCMWTHWNLDLSNANTSDPDWLNHSFTDFVDENGNSTTISVATTVLLPILTYQYEPCTIGGMQPGQKKKLQGKELEQFLKTGAPSRLDFVQRFPLQQTLTAPVGKQVNVPIRTESTAITNALQGGNTRVVLTVANVDIPEKRDFYVRIFLDKPDASAQTSIDDPHYAGSFGFFYDESAMKNHGVTPQNGPSGRPRTGYLVDVTNTLRNLNQAGSLPADVNVSFVPVAYARRESTGSLNLDRLDLSVVRFGEQR